MAAWFTSIASQAIQLADSLVAQADAAQHALEIEHQSLRKGTFYLSIT